MTESRDIGMRLRGWIRGGVILGATAFLGGCGGDEAAPAFEPKLSVIQTMVFGPSCGLSSTCHGGNAPQKGLKLSGSAGARSPHRLSGGGARRQPLLPGGPGAPHPYLKN